MRIRAGLLAGLEKFEARVLVRHTSFIVQPLGIPRPWLALAKPADAAAAGGEGSDRSGGQTARLGLERRAARSSVSSGSTFRSISPPSTRPRGSACTTACSTFGMCCICRLFFLLVLTAILHVIAVHLYCRAALGCRAVRTRFLLRLWAVSFLVLAAAWTAGAQSIFEKLVMPGELVQGHAKLEKECANCHESVHEGIAVAALPCLPQGHRHATASWDAGCTASGPTPSSPTATSATRITRAGPPTSCSSTRKPSITP